MFSVSKNIVSQKLDNNIVLFDLKNSTLVTLNETAAFIFAQLKKGEPPANIAKRLSEKFDVPIEQIKKDCQACIKRLTDLGIITNSRHG